MMLAGMTKKYTNAFTIVSPAILDLGELTLLDRVSRKNLQHVLNWGITIQREFTLTGALDVIVTRNCRTF